MTTLKDEALREAREAMKRLKDVEQMLSKEAHKNTILEKEKADLEARVKEAESKPADDPVLKALVEVVDERLKYWQGVVSAGNGPAQEQTLPLDDVITTIAVRPVPRELPSVDTTTTYGEVVELIAHGKLDARRSEKEIKEMLADPGAITFKALDRLVQEKILVKTKDSGKHVFFQKHPRVRAVIKNPE